MWLLSCYVHNHLCEVYIMDIVHLWTSSYNYAYNIASPVIEIFYIERYFFRWINF